MGLKVFLSYGHDDNTNLVLRIKRDLTAARHRRWIVTQAKRRIGELDPRRPLASQELGVEVLAVTTRMLEDVTAWAQLSRMKPVEPG